MPSRAYTSFLLLAAMLTIGRQYRVNALSGLYLISTLSITLIYSIITCVNALSGLYLISTNYIVVHQKSTTMWCQCPLGLIPHFYKEHISWKCKQVNYVSMPSRAYTSFLQYTDESKGIDH